uniref:Methionine adenosyltransferase 2 subunit beta n=1 Tax=Bursaphelenchus xylophilus TaxID=6326 RepID=A0A1I7RLL1_BURXY
MMNWFMWTRHPYISRIVCFTIVLDVKNKFYSSFMYIGLLRKGNSFNDAELTCMMVKNVLLVGGASEFGQVLAKKLRAVGAKVYILDTDVVDTDDDLEFIHGESCNTDLVQMIIKRCHITRLFLLPKISHDEDVSTQGRRILMGTAALIDEIRRQTSELPQVIQVGQFQEGSFLVPEYRAAVLSTEAFLHSYAVSYRMDVRLIRIPTYTVSSAYDHLAKEILEISSETTNEKAKIYNLEAETAEIPSVSESTPDVRILVFGANGWIGKQFTDCLNKHGLQYVIAKTRPGDSSDYEIRREIAEIAPSHIVSLIGRTHGKDCGNIDYLEGGPDKLKENVRDNLYGPFMLANIAERFGIHFTYIGTGCLFAHAKNSPYYREEDLPNFRGNKYGVVKGFTDRLIGSFSHSLNVRIRLPFNDEDSPRNLVKKITSFNNLIDVPNSITYLPDLLPALINIIINKTTGTINLTSPGVISFVEMAEIFSEVTGQKLEYESVQIEDDVDGTAKRSHCKLSTDRLQTLQPQVLNVKDAVRKAAKALAQVG